MHRKKKLIVPISGQVTGESEARNVMAVAQSTSYGGYLWTNQFERGLADFMGARLGIMVNSGSSANLLALTALELPFGSEVITTAVNFPTTVSPIIQLGLKPVFVDVDPKTLGAIWPDKLKGIKAGIVAHALGNPSDVPDGIPFIEDCCDALGSMIGGHMVGRKGIAATVSLYPAHHITTGEGGMILTDSPKLKKIIESYRDWGRDCFCEPGRDNTCGKRFDGDYDHKYTYSRIGYNLKASDFQAAVGLAQLDRLDDFIKIRCDNWRYLYENLQGLPIEIVEPAPDSEPSWFGFPFMTDRRNELARYLDEHGIGSRPIMGGNLLRQPAFRDIDCRVIGSLDGANRIHTQGLWIGVFPGITPEMRKYQVKIMREFFK